MLHFEYEGWPWMWERDSVISERGRKSTSAANTQSPTQLYIPLSIFGWKLD